MQLHRGIPLLIPLLSVALSTASHCEPPRTLALTPRVRAETTGGRLELGKPVERLVMVVARALPVAKPRARVAEAFLYLPQTTERQTVRELVCVPPPADLLEDRWGNQIAHFVLGTPAPNQSPHACWMARVSLRDLKANLDDSAPPPSQAVQEAVSRDYLGDSLKYVLSADRIRQQAHALTGPNGRPEETAAGIHRYLAASLVYERLGAHDDAPTVLARGTGSCSEKAFCWIALARSAALPARFTGAGRVALVFADNGPGTTLSIPFRTEQYRRYNSLSDAASKVGAYAAEPGKRQTARVLVADDRLWFDFNGKPVFSVRNFAVAPGRLGLRTWGDETKARVEALRVRELSREQADEAAKQRSE